MMQNRHRVARVLYYFLCLMVLIGLSSIRSGPVYGKLDFYLLPEAPWREPWRPMIEKTIAEGRQPILSDMITDTVLRGLFAQPSPGFRYDNRFASINIEDFLSMNHSYHLPPIGALLLLKQRNHRAEQAKKVIARNRKINLRENLPPGDTGQAGQREFQKQDRPYRCVINLHDYPPSWVPFETGHWSPLWSQPSHIYAFHGKRGKELRQFLKDNPLPGCLVYF